MPAAPALPVGVEPPLVVTEPADEALEDVGELDDPVPADETDGGEEREEEREEGEVEEGDGGETDDEEPETEVETALLREDSAEEGRPGAVEMTDLELVGALVVLAVDEAPAGPLCDRGPEALAVAPVLPAALDGTELGETVLRERLVVGAPRVTLEVAEAEVTPESIWKNGVKLVLVFGFESSTISTV